MLKNHTPIPRGGSKLNLVEGGPSCSHGVMMNQVFSSAVLVGIFTGIVVGQPTVKTGDCPTLTRYIAPASDNSIQNNLTPAQSINCIETQPGLKVELWGSEQTPGAKITYLQDFTFDER